MFSDKPNSIQQSKKVPIFRTVLNYSLLLLLFFSFYSQQVLAFSLYERGNVEVNSLYQFNSVRHQPNLMLKEGFPSQEIFSAVEMELEEDEEVSHAAENIHAIDSKQHANFEFLYQSIIRTKYLHLNAVFDQQPADPLFLLYHSWKYSIS